MSYNKGTKYLFAGNYTKALQFFKREPLEFKEKYINMGNCYRYFNDLDKAEKCYLKANAVSMPAANGGVKGEYTLALNNLGLIEYARGNDALAIDYYKRALSIDPVYYDCLWNLGNATLRSYFSSPVGNAEEWKLGWTLYEYRFKRVNPVAISTGLPRWDGRNGQKIVVLTEQGLGDKIMFGRYISLLAAENDVYVQCHPSLDCFYDSYKIVRDCLEVPDAVSIPICSLAGHFGLVDEKWLAGKFVERKFSGFNIGCVWHGSATHANNRNRSCPSSYFSALAEYGNLYSITPDAKAAANVTALRPTEWSETASIVLGLDLVVTVDTSIVHLCGTLGVPCIMIQPLMETDFRWGLGHSDTPWYESVVIVENNNSWDAAFAQVRKILDNVNSK